MRPKSTRDKEPGVYCTTAAPATGDPETRAVDTSSSELWNRRDFLGLIAGGSLAGAFGPTRILEASTVAENAADSKVKHRLVDVGGVRIFYREAGPSTAPGVLLLHGFPSSSHMFRNLIPALADRYHVVAPDYPGFGHSDFPDPERFDYTFESYARAMRQFTRVIGLDRYVLYVQDYGSPVGLRLALLEPGNVRGLIVQNGNAYEEGLSTEWGPIKTYWRDPSPANREKLRGWLNPDGTRLQYAAGLSDAQRELLSPDTWTLDWLLLGRPGNLDVQLDLFADYETNVALYPEFQAYFRRHRPPTLVVWGRQDPFFTVEGASAYRRDIPDAEIHFYDAGHFALETHCKEIAATIRDFLARRVPAARGKATR